jgi:agmatine deiminase
MTQANRRLPAEWEHQSGVMLTWPHASGDWAADLPQVEPVFYSIALEIVRRETLLLSCATNAQRERVRTTLLEQGAPETRLVTAVIPSNDTWARDHGPLTVLEDGRARLLDFRFNGWGNRHPWQLDNAISGRLAGLGCFASTSFGAVDLVLEGGSIESDGRGTLLATRSCLLHPRRNPHLSQLALEQKLRDLLGVQRILWLEHGGLQGDDTDGHIDMLVRICTPDTLVYQGCTETAYPFYDELAAMGNELRQLTTLTGEPYKVVALPWPGAKFDPDGARLPASYANFLVINGAVLVPGYDDPADESAARLIQGCFPGRELVMIPCLPLIQQYGSLHCSTMQFPQGVEFASPTA